MYILWLMILMFGSIFAEVLLGNGGFSLPLTLLSGFYFAVVMPWRRAFFPLMGAALMMECFRLHVFPVYLFSMAVLLLLGNLAKRSGDLGSLAFRPLAGLAAALVWLVFLGLDLLIQNRLFPGSFLRMSLVQMAVQPAVFLFLQLFFDFQAEVLHFRTWSESSRYDFQNLDKESAE